MDNRVEDQEIPELTPSTTMQYSMSKEEIPYRVLTPEELRRQDLEWMYHKYQVLDAPGE